MDRRLVIIFCLCFGVLQVNGRKGVGNGEQDWGYVTVRPGAHLFWWLFYTTANVTTHTERPLLIWLQGGPGMSSSGYGNFMEIGPFDHHLQPRNDNLVQDFNVLFVDNPVGSGYSYRNNETFSGCAKNGQEIGKDLVEFLRTFYQIKKEFLDVPLYIFGESYGGKMIIEFVYQLIQSDIHGQLKGIGLGDAYISPIDYIEFYAPMALTLGILDKQQLAPIEEIAKNIRNLIDNQKYAEASDLETTMRQTLTEKMKIINMYNMFIKTNNANSQGVDFFAQLTELETLMNDKMKKFLDIPKEAEWEFLSGEVHTCLKNDLILPITDKVEYILNRTNIKIIVYNGIQDFLVNTAGTIAWMNKLNWNGKEEWLQQANEAVEVDAILEAYCRKAQNLVLYVVLRAGHSVPIDNMPAMREILRRELGFGPTTTSQ